VLSGPPTRFSRSCRALVAGAALFIPYLVPAAVAADWYRYENSFFRAYSDADEDKALELLVELEDFRAAFVQVGNVTIPADAPKTRVVIARSGNDFTKYSGSDFVDGFAVDRDDGSILVLPATGYMDWPKSVIRHEYGHALLKFKDFDYPWWFEEGFAEFVSSLEFSPDGTSFTVGAVTDRARYGGRPSVDWDELVAHGFVGRRMGRRDASNAYLQSWLLVHYVTLGKPPENARKLQAYFDRLGAGESSADAFANAFGAPASELWLTDIEQYAARMPVYTIRFIAGSRDREFVRSRPDESEYRPLIDYLLHSARAVRYARSPRNALNHLPGRWAELSPDGDCVDPQQVDVDEHAGTITIDRFMHDEDGGWEPRTFSYERGEKRSLMLTVMDGAQSGEADAPWRLQLRNKSVMCLSRPDWGELPCDTMMKKCGP
jgi:hypothetical protein